MPGLNPFFKIFKPKWSFMFNSLNSILGRFIVDFKILVLGKELTSKIT